jgi:DNA polymerase I-like protein with 3'-5' exonuclease and polymerase domains
VPVTVVGRESELDAFARAVTGAVALAIDTETNVATGRMRVLSAATRDRHGAEAAWVVDGRDLPPPLLAPILAGAEAAGWNASFDARVTDEAIFEPAGTPASTRIRWWDAMLADALLHQGRSGFGWYHGLAWATERYLGFSAEGKGTTQLSFDHERDLDDTQVAYAAADAVETLWVSDRLRALITDAGLEEVAALEMAARPFLDDLARCGFPFDAAAYEEHLVERRAALERCLSVLATLTGGGQGNLFSPEVEPSWNPGSEPQAKAALNRFASEEVAAYAAVHLGEARPLQGYDTLNATALAEIGGPLAGALLEYRHHAKILSTYGSSLLAAVDGGRIRPQYVQVVGVNTGRLASRNPNAQNLAPETKPFIRPGSEDRVLVTADLSQAELRWMAQVSGDRAMRAAFAAGVDVHVATAAAMFGVDMEELATVDPARHSRLRARAKTINFGIIYGLGPAALARSLSLAGQATSLADAQGLLRAYLEAYPGVAEWLSRHDRVVDDLAARPPEIDWDLTLRLADELGPFNVARREFRQQHDRWPTNAETAEVLGVDPSSFDWLAPYEEAVVLRPDGTPIEWASRTLAGRRRRFDIGTWGVLRTAAVDAARRPERRWAAARDELAAEFGVALTEGGQPLSEPALQKAFDDRSLRRRLIDRIDGAVGRPERDRLLDRAFSQRVGALGNAHRNAPIQGGVADAMLATYGLLWEAFVDDPEVCPTQTVHDSVVMECPLQRAAEVRATVVATMTRAFARFCPDVPAVVDAEVRRSLADDDIVDLESLVLVGRRNP